MMEEGKRTDEEVDLNESERRKRRRKRSEKTGV